MMSLPYWLMRNKIIPSWKNRIKGKDNQLIGFDRDRLIKYGKRTEQNEKPKA